MRSWFLLVCGLWLAAGAASAESGSVVDDAGPIPECPDDCGAAPDAGAPDVCRAHWGCINGYRGCTWVSNPVDGVDCSTACMPDGACAGGTCNGTWLRQTTENLCTTAQCYGQTDGGPGFREVNQAGDCWDDCDRAIHASATCRAGACECEVRPYRDAGPCGVSPDPNLCDCAEPSGPKFYADGGGCRDLDAGPDNDSSLTICRCTTSPLELPWVSLIAGAALLNVLRRRRKRW